MSSSLAGWRSAAASRRKRGTLIPNNGSIRSAKRERCFARVMLPFERAEYDRHLEQLRKSLDPAPLDRMDGRSRDVDGEAITFARAGRLAGDPPCGTPSVQGLDLHRLPLLEPHVLSQPPPGRSRARSIGATLTPQRAVGACLDRFQSFDADEDTSRCDGATDFSRIGSASWAAWNSGQQAEPGMFAEQALVLDPRLLAIS